MAPVTTELKVLVKAVGKGELKELEAALNKLAVTAKTKVDTNFKKVSLELKKVQRTSAQSISNLRGYRNAWRDIAEQVDVTSREFQVATRNAEKLDNQLQKVERRRPQGSRAGRLARGAGAIAAGGIFGGPEGLLGGAIGLGVGGPAGAAVGAALGAQVGGLRKALGGVAEYGAELNKLRIALEGVTKTQQEYNQALEFIQSSTKEFAIPQSVLTRQFTRLQASVSGANGSLRDTQTAFRGIVAAVRATGGSLSDVDAALTATAQVFSKGKVSAEELRQQIGERLPGAFTLFAESIGKTPAELDKALERGEVSLSDFQSFAEAIFERYGETARVIADGPDAAGDRLTVVLEELNEKVGPELQRLGAQFQTFTSNAIKGFLDLFDAMGRAGKAIEEANIGTVLENQRKTLAQAQRTLVRTDITPLEKKFAEDIIARYTPIIQRADFIGPIPSAPSNLPTAQDDPTRKPPRQRRERDPMIELRRQANEAFRDLEASFAAVAETKLAENLRVNALEIAEARERGNKASQFQLELQRKLIPLQISEEALAVQIAKRQEQIEKERAKGIDVGNQARALLKDQTNLAKVRAELESKRAEFAQDLADFNKKNLEETLKLEDERFQKVREFNELLKEQAQLEDPMQGFKAGLDSYVESLGTAFDAVQNLTQTALGGLSDAISRLVTEGTFNFREFASSLLRDMADIIVRGIAMRSILSIFGVGAPAVSGSQALEAGYNLGSSLAAGFANGGIMTGQGPLDLKTYARGGIARSPQLAMFGEGSMPEAYVPLPDGRSIPVTMRGGGAGNIVVNVDAKGTQVEGDQGRSKQLGTAISAAVQAELIKQQRPGGLLNR
jgi:lambda family phage tail tape measure protein